MAVLKCPKCGRLCREGLVPFPRCAHCHEQLLKCRYCADYDARILDCVSPFRADEPSIRDPDLYTACPYHRTTLLPAPKALRSRVWVTAVVLGLLAAGGAMFALQPRPVGPRPNLYARLAPLAEEAVRDQPMVVELQIRNPGPGRASEVIVGLDRTYRKHVRLTGVEPEPLARRSTLKWDRMWFSELEQGQMLAVSLHVTPITGGTWRLRAEVRSPDTSRREVVSRVFEIIQ